MTRATLFRVILAMRLLPNFTAYWWVLPRRMKRCRTQMQAIMQMAAAHQRKSWARVLEKALTFRLDASLAPISNGEFRMPFTLIGKVVIVGDENP